MKHRQYDIQKLREIIAKSNSIADVLMELGLIAAGGNYSTIRKKIKEYAIDTSHFTGQSSRRGKSNKRIPTEVYLKNERAITSDTLRRRLINEGYLEHKCSSCERTEWLGNPIPLELEHKDGNHDNNELLNLCLLCPNCHTFTPTYRGKKLRKPLNYCLCGKKIRRKSKQCEKCYHYTKKEWYQQQDSNLQGPKAAAF